VEWVTQPAALNPRLTFFLLRLEAQAAEQGLSDFVCAFHGLVQNQFMLERGLCFFGANLNIDLAILLQYLSPVSSSDAVLMI
jgi:hypothetical protein